MGILSIVNFYRRRRKPVDTALQRQLLMRLKQTNETTRPALINRTGVFFQYDNARKQSAAGTSLIPRQKLRPLQTYARVAQRLICRGLRVLRERGRIFWEYGWDRVECTFRNIGFKRDAFVEQNESAYDVQGAQIKQPSSPITFARRRQSGALLVAENGKTRQHTSNGRAQSRTPRPDSRAALSLSPDASRLMDGSTNDKLDQTSAKDMTEIKITRREGPRPKPRPGRA
ncbi:hypothetical protein EVAR_45678_1 [Eumeta japonica]|uniref:Uncharacterized protein n=1 Tax=Eumeta variegata TaxID=151549 RepID=A0A4C1XJB6_EUMVA|nr:hypothetical protein EVAR_45678_1 [Eumeta japonica]